MPFIYRDLELNAVDDFVDVELVGVDGKALRLLDRPIPSRDPLGGGAAPSVWWPLDASRKIVLLGEAGIGKTTIFRHLVLSILRPSKDNAVFSDRRGLMPIYVPLKATDANGASPILRHIEASHPYFAGARGMRRLARLAKSRRVALFLDGYDEAAHVGGTGALLAELGAIYDDYAKMRPANFSAAHREIYPHLRGCRTLLSSRREFLSAHRPALGLNTKHLGTRGVGAQRQVLVHRIFERYRKTAPSAYEQRLNEEVFLQRLSQRANREIEQISRNPLFLTALCFTYAQHVLHGRDAEETWRRGTHELILECVQLLVEDIDQNKVRGLNPVQRQALIDRRASYPEEKRLVLRAIAGKSYEEGVAAFTHEWLSGVAASAIRALPPSQRTADILEALRGEDPTANLILQLIYSGLLIPNFDLAESATFDFPHRRFREVLAVQHFDSEEGCALLCSRCGDESLSSLIPYYAQRTQRWLPVALALARAAAELGPGSGPQALLLNLLEFAPSDTERSVAVRAAVEALFGAGARPDAGLSRKLLVTLRPADLEWLEDMLKSALAQRDARGIAVCLPAIAAISAERAAELLATQFHLASPRDALGWQMVSQAMEQSPRPDQGLVLRALSALLPNPGHDTLSSPDFFAFLKVAWVGRDVLAAERVESALRSHFPERVHPALNAFLAEAGKSRGLAAADCAEPRPASNSASEPVLAFFRHPAPRRLQLWA